MVAHEASSRPTGPLPAAGGGRRTAVLAGAGQARLLASVDHPMPFPPPDPRARTVLPGSPAPIGVQPGSPLARRAAAHGVALAYRTDRGVPVTVAAEVVEAVCAAMEQLAVPAEGPVPPVVVAWDGVLVPVPCTTAVARARVRCEQGEERVLRVDGHRLVLVGPPLPLGAHVLDVEPVGAGPSAVVHATVLAPPTMVPVPPRRDGGRHWGWFVPLAALRTRRHDAAADLTDLGALFDWAGGHGADTVLTLPMVAGFSDPPVEPSPYAPSSRRFWNELVVDVHRLPDGPPPPAPPPAVGADGRLDLDTVAAHRHAALAVAAVAWAERGGEHDPTFRAWLDGQPLAPAYARFRAVAARHGRDWRRWPERLRAGRPDRIRPDDGAPGVELLHLYAQFRAEQQMAELAGRVRADGRLLGLDLPVGCHADGFDVWCGQDLFVPDVAVGAPPDAFWTAGQNWGFPPLHPAVARASGHAYLRAVVRLQARHAGLLRLDHVMGLLRQWWVPAGGPPSAGTYVAYPAEEQVAVVLLEAWRSGAVVVGENLGTVPPEVEVLMERHGMLGTFVAQDRGAEGLAPAPVRSLATLNTHDMPTFAGWAAGRDVDDRAALGLLDASSASAQHQDRVGVVASWRASLGLGVTATPAEVMAAGVARLAAGPAAVVVATLEDLWMEEAPQNTPGTWRERPNWLRPCAVALDDIDAHPVAATAVATIAAGASGPAATGC